MLKVILQARAYLWICAVLGVALLASSCTSYVYNGLVSQGAVLRSNLVSDAALDGDPPPGLARVNRVTLAVGNHDFFLYIVDMGADAHSQVASSPYMNMLATQSMLEQFRRLGYSVPESVAHEEDWSQFTTDLLPVGTTSSEGERYDLNIRIDHVFVSSTRKPGPDFTGVRIRGWIEAKRNRDGIQITNKKFDVSAKTRAATVAKWTTLSATTDQISLHTQAVEEDLFLAFRNLILVLLDDLDV